MTEQRKTEAEPSRNLETLGEGVVLDALTDALRWNRVQTERDMRTGDFRSASAVAALIDTRFAPLIEAAEAVVERFDNPRDYFGENLSTLVQDLRAAIANAKGGAK